ncbi:Sec-independent protein translocase protein TatB [Maricaulis sp. D1M11]|uniref:Sec-independent protein translocase protein TatB n=1 Tax=Maricaulis sp. D1M11 TaxID=3076117 RepID=UPI0039B68EF7
MSPGIGGPELLVVLILALVVVGPQQLPVMMRRVGQFLGQMRMMAREFQRNFEEIGRETELSELRQEIEALKKANPVNEVRDELNATAQDLQSARLNTLHTPQQARQAAEVAGEVAGEASDDAAADLPEAEQAASGLSSSKEPNA